jgi:hypothetical protein
VILEHACVEAAAQASRFQQGKALSLRLVAVVTLLLAVIGCDAIRLVFTGSGHGFELLLVNRSSIGIVAEVVDPYDTRYFGFAAGTSGVINVVAEGRPSPESVRLLDGSCTPVATVNGSFARGGRHRVRWSCPDVRIRKTRTERLSTWRGFMCGSGSRSLTAPRMAHQASQMVQRRTRVKAVRPPTRHRVGMRSHIGSPSPTRSRRSVHYELVLWIVRAC